MTWPFRRPVITRRGTFVVALLALAGLSLTARGLWIPAKAALGQVLLEQAWEETLAAGPAGGHHRPWPWADTVPVARLTLPEHHRSWVVLQGVTGEALAWGPGWMPTSARPGESKGRGGVTVLAGHRDTHFRILQSVRPGDRLELETPGGVHAFRVTTVELVDSRAPGVVARLLAGPASAATTGALLLVTCYPFDSLDPGGPLRWVVTALPESAQSSG